MIKRSSEHGLRERICLLGKSLYDRGLPMAAPATSPPGSKMEGF